MTIFWSQRHLSGKVSWYEDSRYIAPEASDCLVCFYLFAMDNEEEEKELVQMNMRYSIVIDFGTENIPQDFPCSLPIVDRFGWYRLICYPTFFSSFLFLFFQTICLCGWSSIVAVDTQTPSYPYIPVNIYIYINVVVKKYFYTKSRPTV